MTRFWQIHQENKMAALPEKLAALLARWVLAGPHLHLHRGGGGGGEPLPRAGAVRPAGGGALPRPRALRAPAAPLRPGRRRLQGHETPRQGHLHRHLGRERGGQDGGQQVHHAVHRRHHQPRPARRGGEGEDGAAAVQLRPGGLRQRQDQAQRQLQPLRQVHGHQLRLQGRPHRRPHPQLPPGEVPGPPAATGREELPRLLPAAAGSPAGAAGLAAPLPGRRRLPLHPGGRRGRRLRGRRRRLPGGGGGDGRHRLLPRGAGLRAPHPGRRPAPGQRRVRGGGRGGGGGGRGAAGGAGRADGHGARRPAPSAAGPHRGRRRRRADREGPQPQGGCLRPGRLRQGRLRAALPLDRGARQRRHRRPRLRRPPARQEHRHRRPRHLRLRDLRHQQLRAVLHQLLQRETAAALHRAGAAAGAGRVPAGGHRLAEHRVLQQRAHRGAGGAAAPRRPGAAGRGLPGRRHLHRPPLPRLHGRPPGPPPPLRQPQALPHGQDHGVQPGLPHQALRWRCHVLGGGLPGQEQGHALPGLQTALLQQRGPRAARHVARRRAEHHRGHQAPADRRHALQELHPGPGGEPRLQGALLRALHQTQRPEVARALRPRALPPPGLLPGAAGERPRAPRRLRLPPALPPLPPAVQDDLRVHVAQPPDGQRPGGHASPPGAARLPGRRGVRPQQGLHPHAAHPLLPRAGAGAPHPHHRPAAAEGVARRPGAAALPVPARGLRHHGALQAAQGAGLPAAAAAPLPARARPPGLRQGAGLAPAARRARALPGGQPAPLPQVASAADREEHPPVGDGPDPRQGGGHGGAGGAAEGLGLPAPLGARLPLLAQREPGAGAALRPPPPGPQGEGAFRLRPLLLPRPQDQPLREEPGPRRPGDGPAPLQAGPAAAVPRAAGAAPQRRDGAERDELRRAAGGLPHPDPGGHGRLPAQDAAGGGQPGGRAGGRPPGALPNDQAGAAGAGLRLHPAELPRAPAAADGAGAAGRRRAGFREKPRRFRALLAREMRVGGSRSPSPPPRDASCPAGLLLRTPPPRAPQARVPASPPRDDAEASVCAGNKELGGTPPRPGWDPPEILPHGLDPH